MYASNSISTHEKPACRNRAHRAPRTHRQQHRRSQQPLARVPTALGPTAFAVGRWRWHSSPIWTCWRAAGKRGCTATARGGDGEVTLQRRWPRLHRLTLLSSLNEETFYGLDCPCLQKVAPGTWERPQPESGASPGRGTKAGLSHRISVSLQKPRLSSDLQPSGQSPAEVGVQVTLAEGHPVKTFRQAAILVVAVTKLLKRPSHHDFADSDLGSFLDAVFGRVCGVGEVTGGRCVLGGGVLSPLGTLAPLLTVCRPAEPVAFQRFDSSYAGAPVYRYIRSQSFDIHDIDHKCFTLESPTQLVALHLQGPSANRKGEETPVLSRSLLCLPPRQQPAHPVSLLRSEAQHCSVPAQELEGQRRGHADTRGAGHQGVQALHVLRDERRRAHAAAGGEWAWRQHPASRPPTPCPRALPASLVPQPGGETRPLPLISASSRCRRPTSAGTLTASS
uniref:Uncharacterized protein n=1 Tax=Apteryx owenii TaxID=8824 RepID=A0A8B9PFS9_APTOW